MISAFYGVIALIAVIAISYIGYLLFNFFKYNKRIKSTYLILGIVFGASLCLTMTIASITYSYNGILAIAFLLSLGGTILSAGFFLMDTIFKYDWLKNFYIFGIFCTMITIFFLQDTAFSEAGGVLIGLEIFGMTGVAMAASIYYLITRNTSINPAYPAKNHSMISHYKEAGLSNDEIDELRDQLAIAKESIVNIEAQFAQSAKLRTIEIRHNTVMICKHFFKEIVQNPTQYQNASHFLYKLLPTLENLLEKYNEVNSHIAKNKQTYLILEKSVVKITDICNEITEEYIRFHEDDYRELDDEIELASRVLHTQEEEEDIINDLLADDLKED